MTYWQDVWAVLKTDGIDLDKTEAALLGIPNGDTISIWEAMEAQHGVFQAVVACAIFSVLIQWGHCRKQLLGQPMKPVNYIRAMALLLAPIVVVLWLL